MTNNTRDIDAALVLTAAAVDASQALVGLYNINANHHAQESMSYLAGFLADAAVEHLIGEDDEAAPEQVALNPVEVSVGVSDLEPGEPLKECIQLTPAEIQSGLDRVRWAEALIRKLPESHDGRNSWLMNYGTEKATT